MKSATGKVTIVDTLPVIRAAGGNLVKLVLLAVENISTFKIDSYSNSYIVVKII